jgi:tetratricopeptide (TPR) repeat protein
MKKIFTIFTFFAVTNSFAAISSDSAEFYFKKGMDEKTAKHYLVASTYFEKAITFDKSYTEAYIQNGHVNNFLRKTDKVKTNFLKAYELQPSNTEVIKELSTVYFDFRQWDKAIEFAKKCPSCENSSRILGIANFKKENYAEAERFLMAALTKNPADAEANYTLAKNYIEVEMERKAVPYFVRAVELNPEKPAWAYELGLLYFSQNHYKEAVSTYELAVKNGYTVNNDYNENYGYALIYSGQFAKGEEKILEIFKRKGNKEILRELAQILYAQKQYDRTLDYCQKLLEIDPRDGKALYQAGLSFIKLGKKDRGENMCNKAIELDPSLAGKKSAIAGDQFGL